MTHQWGLHALTQAAITGRHFRQSGGCKGGLAGLEGRRAACPALGPAKAAQGHPAVLY